MDEKYWGKVYEKAEHNRIFIQLLKAILPDYLEMLNMLR